MQEDPHPQVEQTAVTSKEVAERMLSVLATASASFSGTRKDHELIAASVAGLRDLIEAFHVVREVPETSPAESAAQ